jgi:hypothetical protein
MSQRRSHFRTIVNEPYPVAGLCLTAATTSAATSAAASSSTTAAATALTTTTAAQGPAVATATLTAQ